MGEDGEGVPVDGVVRLAEPTNQRTSRIYGFISPPSMPLKQLRTSPAHSTSMVKLSIDVDVVDAVFRVFSALSFLCLGAAGAWGFLLAAGIAWSQPSASDPRQGDIEYAAYIGIQALYFSLFGVFGFLSELRLARLEATVLRRLNFLHTHLGRGLFSLYAGSVFLFLPWDTSRSWINRVCGSLCISAGGLLVLFSLFAPKSGGSGSGGSSAGAITPSAAAAWEAATVAGGDAETNGTAPLAENAEVGGVPGSPIVVGNPFLRATGTGGGTVFTSSS